MPAMEGASPKTGMGRACKRPDVNPRRARGKQTFGNPGDGASSGDDVVNQREVFFWYRHRTGKNVPQIGEPFAPSQDFLTLRTSAANDHALDWKA